jgi:hypothetical protein
LSVAFIVFLAGCGAKETKKDIFDLVENNYDEIVAACENKDSEALLAIDGITQVRIAKGYVLVYCKGAGIAPSSQDYGFYYSEDNSPVTVGCNLGIVCYAADLSPEGDGYQCIKSGNIFYTEHIEGNIYFYSNAY